VHLCRRLLGRRFGADIVVAETVNAAIERGRI
jgi:hypothetical protein